MTEAERSRVISVLAGKIQETGVMKLSQVSPTLERAGIPRTIYEGVGPKKWLVRYFPEFVIGGPSDEDITLAKPLSHAESGLAKIETILTNILQQEGSILFSKVPKELENHGIDYRKFAGNQGLKGWLLGVFPKFAESENKLSLVLSKTVSTEAKTKLIEVRQMHALSFMGPWNQNGKLLRQLNLADTKSDTELRNIVACSIGRGLLGERDVMMIEALNDEEPRLVFNTGLTNADGKSIYSILELNPHNADNTKQYWAMHGFAHLGGDENNELGHWLADRFNLIDGTQTPMLNVTDLTAQLDVLKELRSNLLPTLQAYVARVSDGYAPEPKLEQEIGKYENAWEQLQEMIRQFRSLRDSGDLSLEEYGLMLNEQNLFVQQFRQAINLFDQVAEGMSAVYEKYRVRRDENSRYMLDKQWVHDQFQVITEDVEIEQMRELLKPYQALRRIMSAKEQDDMNEQDFDLVQKHFSDIKVKFTFFMMIDTPEEERKFLDPLDNIIELLNRCISSKRSLAAAKEKNFNTDRLLLDTINYAGTDWDLRWLEYVATALPDDVQQQELIFGTAAETDGAELGTIAQELTFYGAANRLYAAMSNQDRLAERYLLLGLQLDSDRCVPMLLKIYREENRSREFETVWVRYRDGLSPGMEDMVYWLSIQVDTQPADALQIADTNTYMQYREDCLKLLIQAANQVGDTDLAERYSARLEAIYSTAAPNELEEAVICGDVALMTDIAASDERLEPFYTPEQIVHIREVLDAAEYPRGRDDFSVGKRLYMLQANQNQRAERYFWNTLIKPNASNCMQLMRLLVEEKRWEECVWLYKCYQSILVKNMDCRKLSMLAQMHLSEEDAQFRILENLQDCLGLLTDDAQYRALIEQHAANNPFFSAVLRIHDMLDSPLLRSVALQDAFLRETAFDQELLVRMGFSDDRILSIKNLYTNDEYPHGMDASCVAQRMFLFVGQYRDIAESIAEFALPDVQAAKLLWTIYDAQGRKEDQLQLLKNYSVLRNEHEIEYLHLLFWQEEHETFLEEMGSCNLMDPVLQVMEAITNLIRGTAVSVKMLDLSDALGQYCHPLSKKLLGTLVEKDRADEAVELICSNFECWLECSSTTEELLELVTCNKMLPDSMLDQMQQRVQELQLETLAVFLHEQLHVDNFAAVTEEYYANGLEQVRQAPYEEQMQTIRKMKLLYHSYDDELDMLLVGAMLKQILDVYKESKVLAKELSELFKTMRVSAETLDRVHTLLKGQLICLEFVVYDTLSTVSLEAGYHEKNLYFFHEISKMPQAQDRHAFRAHMCKLYLDALVNNYFPSEFVNHVDMLCTETVRSRKCLHAFLCLYYIKRMLGQPHHAEIALYQMTDFSLQAKGEYLTQLTDNAVTECWKGEHPNLLDLFQKMLNSYTLEQIKDYLSFTSRFMKAESDTMIRLKSNGNQFKTTLNMSDGIDALKLLLAEPNNVMGWSIYKQIPLDMDSPGYAKFFSMYCERYPQYWKNCADLCEKAGLYELQLDALNAWINSSTWRKERWRAYINDPNLDKNKLNNAGDIIAIWGKNPKFVELMDVLFDRLDPTDPEMFDDLNIICVLAVQSGRPDMLHLLWKRMEAYLFGTYSDLSVVVVSRLLLDERIQEAHEWLSAMSQSPVQNRYQHLIRELECLSVEELAQWRENEENIMLLRLIRPNGKRPSIQQLTTTTAKAMLEGRNAQAIYVLNRLMEIFPDDWGVCNALFNLACDDYENQLPLLHRTLMALTRLPGNEGFASRTQREYVERLAAMNAVLIALRRTSEIDDGYDFEKKAGAYAQDVCKAFTQQEVYAVDELQDSIAKDLQNRNGADLKNRCHAYMCCITGNWRSFIRNNLGNPNFYSNCMVCVGNHADSYGLSKSILRVFSSLPMEERTDFMTWISGQIHVQRIGIPRERGRQVAFVLDFINKGYFDKLYMQDDIPLEGLLRYPYEDYSFFTYYRISILEASTEAHASYLDALIFLCGGLGCFPNVAREFSKSADIQFHQGRDDVAYQYYRTMYYLCDRFNVMYDVESIKQIEKMQRPFGLQQTNIYMEEYRALYNITGLFSRNKGVIQDVQSRDFPCWDVLNMGLRLLATKRSDEVLRLRQYLSVEQANQLDMVVSLVNPQVAEGDKVQMITTVTDPLVRAYLAAIATYGDGYVVKNGVSKRKSRLLPSFEHTASAQELYIKACKQLQNQCNPAVSSTQCSLTHPILMYPKFYVVHTPKDPNQWWGANRMDTDEKMAGIALPPFAEELLPITDGSQDALQEALSKHSELIGKKFHEVFQQRLALSEEIMCRTIGLQLDAKRTYDALLRYGVDMYYCLHSTDTTESKAQAVTILKELVAVDHMGSSSSESYNAFLELVREVAFAELLKSYTTIRAMAEDFSRYLVVFRRLQTMISDKRRGSITIIYNVLEALSNSYVTYSATNSEPLRKALDRSYEALNKIGNNGWVDMKNRLQRLINEEINVMEQLPKLEVAVMNRGTQSCEGYFSGMVKNRGNEAAADITLQISFGDHKRSKLHTLGRLSPGMEAVFEVAYSVEPDTPQMSYQIDVSYTYDGETYTVDPKVGNFVIGTLPEPNLPNRPYHTSGAVAFTVHPETGEIYSPHFFGRQSETRRLRSLVAGNAFHEYHHALVYGIRRTGKTSLLSYFQTYVGVNCPDVLCVKIDVLESNYTIQDVFVTKILQAIQPPAEKDPEEWYEFRKQWETIPEGMSDRDPSSLKRFYLDLRQMTGRGLIVIIDEIDRLFRKLIDNRSEDTKNLDSGLFSSFSSILDDPQCAFAVRFVICGSNWLIRYSTQGDALQQMFQRIGHKIEVGKLPKEDTRKMLQAGTEGYPDLQMTTQVMDMIWEYTGGLVWFTKKLGNEVIDRAREAGRGMLYPYDVVDKLGEILTDNDCQQFYEGCATGELSWLLIDAMQSMAYRKDVYITVKQLCEKLKTDAHQVQQALRMLKAFKIVESHFLNPDAYRFSLDIFRRYFRSTVSSFPQIPEEEIRFVTQLTAQELLSTYSPGADDEDDEDTL